MTIFDKQKKQKKMKTKFSNENWWACCLDATPHFVFAGEKTVCTMLHNDVGDENYEPMEAIVTHDECLANAKLIAAAPELFDACVYALKTFYTIGCTEDAEIVRVLEKVINKAND